MAPVWLLEVDFETEAELVDAAPAPTLELDDWDDDDVCDDAEDCTDAMGCAVEEA